MLRFPVIWGQAEGWDSLLEGVVWHYWCTHTHTQTHTHYEIKGNKEKANKHRDFKQLSSDKKKPILSSVQLVSHVQLVVTPWTAECQAFVSITNPPELAQTHVHQVSDAIQPSHPTVPFSTCLQPFPASVFSSESVLHIRWPKYWSFSFNISPSSEHSGQISFRIDWFEFPAVQGLSRVFSKTTVKEHQFFGAQLSLWSNPHIHTWPLEKQ